ncbi:MAG: hypothetical protein A2Y55_07240 [Actinobacteria bacterium RBG_16_68_12]|nr:MAG: hypothetical protein A2Y55_07240 [Actinobacteria bacterium RBG_16_68_12]
MSEDNKTSMQRLYQEVIGEGRIELIDELVSPGFVEHEAAPGLEPNRDGVKQFFGMFRAAAPDLTATVEDLIAEGDRVVARVWFSGTQTGELFGLPATGKQFRFQAIDILRFEEGLAVEHWGVTDMAGLMGQLGAPAPETAGTA